MGFPLGGATKCLDPIAGVDNSSTWKEDEILTMVYFCWRISVLCWAQISY